MRIVSRRGPVREKGGTVEIGRTGCDGRILFRHKSPTVCQCETVRSHPLISRLLPIETQPHSARLALERSDQITQPHVFFNPLSTKMRVEIADR